MGLEGLEGLRVGEDMQLRERLNVQETVTNIQSNSVGLLDGQSGMMLEACG